MGPAGKEPWFVGEKPDKAGPGPSPGHEESRRLKAEAVLLARYAVLAWTALLLVLPVALVGVVDFDLRSIVGALVTYGGVVAAVALAVGSTGLLIWAGVLAAGRLRRRAIPPPEHGSSGRDGLWDEWLDLPGRGHAHRG